MRNACAVIVIAATWCRSLDSTRLIVSWTLNVNGTTLEAQTFAEIGAYAAMADEALCRASGTTLPLEARMPPQMLALAHHVHERVAASEDIRSPCSDRI